MQEVEGQIRVLLIHLGRCLGRKIDPRDRIVDLIPEYAAYLLNRLMQGDDGKVPYERVKGKSPTILGVELGEKLLCKLPKGAKMEKMRARWAPGVFFCGG